MISLGDFLRNLIRKHFPKSKKRVGSHRKKLRNQDVLGQAGEKRAVKFLKKRGYRIDGKNVRYDDGELDIVAKHEGYLIFVEVKTRRPQKAFHPSQAVNFQKQQKIKQLAYRYVKQFHPRPMVRFDVIAITWPENQEPMIEHFIDAFR